MKPERRSETQSSRGAMVLVCVGCVFGCTAYPTLKPNVPIDCTADSGYDFLQIDNFETMPDMAFYSSGDMATSVSPAATPESIPGGRCNSSIAMVFQSSGHNDWGSLFGFSNFGPRDASAYEGLSFWARAPLGTTNSFTILLDDPNTNNGQDSTMACSMGGGAAPTDAGPAQSCKNYCMPDAGAGAPVTTYVDPTTGMAVGGGSMMAPPADACGNGYAVVQVVTADWRFYTVPFSKFQQGYMPNRVPNPLLTVTGNLLPSNGLRTSALMNVVLRFPKEANAELWMDNLDFYRPKKAGSDGGSDAQRM